MTINTSLKDVINDKTDVEVFFEVQQVPVFNNVLWESREQALNAAKGDMALGFGRSSGHIYNTVFDPDIMDYDQAYENSLHFSPRFQQYVEKLVNDLVERYDMRGKTIVDVGCGKGDFLKLIAEVGGNKGYGFDKSYESTPEDEANKDVTFVQDFYTEAYIDTPMDMLCCRHVLEHIQYPAEFLKGIRRAIGDRLDTVVFFEVPNGLYTLRDMGIWDIIYEHCSYFTPNSLSQLFAACGFNVLRMEEVYGGQFLTIEAKPAATETGSNIEAPLSLDALYGMVQAFSQRYQEKLQTWRKNLADASALGQRVVIWGSGSKGVTFLNVLETTGLIDYAIDINTRKQGKFVAGSGQKIVAPEFLKTYQPDIVLIMNPLYQAEIEQSVQEMGLQPRFMLV